MNRGSHSGNPLTSRSSTYHRYHINVPVFCSCISCFSWSAPPAPQSSPTVHLRDCRTRANHPCALVVAGRYPGVVVIENQRERKSSAVAPPPSTGSGNFPIKLSTGRHLPQNPEKRILGEENLGEGYECSIMTRGSHSGIVVKFWPSNHSTTFSPLINISTSSYGPISVQSKDS
jgi:hypothetical protein